LHFGIGDTLVSVHPGLNRAPLVGQRETFIEGLSDLKLTVTTMPAQRPSSDAAYR
jgi:hypothetical protein